MRILHVFDKKMTSAELLQRLSIQRFKLLKQSEGLKQQLVDSRKEAKETIKMGDEAGFRLASRKYVMLRNTYSSITDLQELAQGMIDVVTVGDILHDVVSTGSNLAKLQGKLGLDSSQFEKSLGKIKTSLVHMESVADTLTMTIESNMPGTKDLSVHQETLKKELLVEIQGEKTEESKLKDKIAIELEKIQVPQG